MRNFLQIILLLILFIFVRNEEENESQLQEEKLNTEEEEEDQAEEFAQENFVYVLKDTNFDEFIKKHPTTLVEFYAPWCGHCKQLAPEYEKAAEEMADTVPLAKVDATVEKELAKRFKIMGFPSIYLFKEGQTEPTAFNGDREAEGIVQWLKEKTDPNYKPPPEEVVALTREAFDEFVGNKPIMLVEFYAPWCGHCKKLAPEYENAAKKLKKHDIPLAKVDATVEKKLAEEYGVQGYPTLKILRNGRRFDYNGPREADGIVNYMLDQAQPAAKKLNSPNDKFMSASDVSIVGFFDAETGPLFEAFVDASERTRGDFGCHFVADPKVVKQFNAKAGQIILYYPIVFASKYEPKSRTFPKSEATSEELMTFYRENATPLVGQMTRQNSATRYAKRPLAVVYYNVDFSVTYREGTQYWRNKVLEIANKYKEKKFHFAVADEEEFAAELNAVGLGDSGLEHNVMVFGVDGKKYPMDSEKYDGELDENLVAFLEDISKGKVKPFVKSQPLPKEDKSPVRTLVASNFDKIVKDESKDVIVEFYAPWCGHCKSFEPKYKQFAAKLAKEEPNFVVAKFDATENDVPEKYAVEGFPTIYFAPAGKKDQPIKYSGNRDLEDLTNFVRDNAVKSFKAAKKEKGGDKKEEL